MNDEDGRYLEPRTALLAAVALFVVGIVVHLAFAAVGRRPTPITVFAFAPPIALLAHLYHRPAAGERRLAALLLWGLLATAIGFFVVFFAVQQYSYLPRDRTAYELFRFDLDLYLWFVLALAGTYVAAAKVDRRRAMAFVLASPLVQASVPVAFVLLEQWLAGGSPGA